MVDKTVPHFSHFSQSAPVGLISAPTPIVTAAYSPLIVIWTQRSLSVTREQRGLIAPQPIKERAPLIRTVCTRSISRQWCPLGCSVGGLLWGGVWDWPLKWWQFESGLDYGDYDWFWWKQFTERITPRVRRRNRSAKINPVGWESWSGEKSEKGYEFRFRQLNKL